MYKRQRLPKDILSAGCEINSALAALEIDRCSSNTLSCLSCSKRIYHSPSPLTSSSKRLVKIITKAFSNGDIMLK